MRLKVECECRVLELNDHDDAREPMNLLIDGSGYEGDYGAAVSITKEQAKQIAEFLIQWAEK